MTNWQSIHRFFEPTKRQRKGALWLIAHSSTRSVLWVSIIYCSQYVVKAIENGNESNFYTRIYILVWIAFIAFLIEVFFKPYIFKFFSNVWGTIDAMIFPIVIHGDNNKYERIGTGKMIALYTKWLGTWEAMTTQILWDLTSSFVVFLAFLFTVYTKDIKLFLMWIVVIILAILWLMFIMPISYKRRRKAKEKIVEMTRLHAKRFMNKFEIMQQWKIAYELSKREELNSERYHVKKIEKIYQWIAFDGWALLATLLFISFIYFTGKWVLGWTSEYSDLVVIIWLGSSFIANINSVMRTVRNMSDKWIDVTKLRELLDDLDVWPKDKDWDHFKYEKWKIEISSISYWYNKKWYVFNDFNLTIQWWKKTALVGISGSWKSTLVKLIAWYLRPDSGSIIVDWQKLSEVWLKSYYPHIGYLTQEPSVFDGTIRENLTYAVSDDIKESKVTDAVQLANCDFIYDLPDWLDTQIWERGVRLSWGQRQRLAIAKIFLKNPKIIILDEPTSALDSFSEEAITQAMHTLFENRTVIIIAHRLQTVKEADDIILLESWEVVERGTHEELVSLWGQYARMLEVQTWF